MSFGVSLSDFVTLPAFAWKVYTSCKGSSTDFRNVSNEVKSLHIVLQRTQEQLERSTLESAQEAELNSVGGECSNVLNDLERVLRRYHNLGTADQRVRDRVRWVLGDISGIRQRLVANTQILVAFNSTLTKYATTNLITHRMSKTGQKLTFGT